MNRRRLQFRVGALLMLVALVALTIMAPGWWCQAVRYWGRKPTIDALERRITIHSPKREGIMGILEHIREATVSRRLPEGLHFYIDGDDYDASDVWSYDLKNLLMLDDFDATDISTREVLDRVLKPNGLKFVLTEPNAFVHITRDQSADLLIVDEMNCYTRRLLGDQ